MHAYLRTVCFFTALALGGVLTASSPGAEPNLDPSGAEPQAADDLTPIPPEVIHEHAPLPSVGDAEFPSISDLGAGVSDFESGDGWQPACPQCGTIGDCGCKVAGGGPVWRFSADAVLLDRTTAASLAMVREASSGNTLIRGASLRFTEKPGARISVSCENRGAAWEFSWLQDDWTSARSAAAVNDLNVVSGTADFIQADTVGVFYRSDLDSFELNRYQPLSDHCSLLAGVRFITLDEHLLIRADDAGSVSDYGIGTDNDLYGFQMGAAYRPHLPHPVAPWWPSLLWLDFVGKAGVYCGEADQFVDFRDVNNTPDIAYANGRRDVVFVGEINIGLSARVLPRVFLRGGYEVLWIEGVALAPEQFLDDRAALAASPALNSGGFYADGFYFGGEIVF